MLHPVSLPDCAEALWRVVELQGALLELACTQNPRDTAVLRTRFPEDVVNWLWQREQKLLTPLVPFSAHTDLPEKQEILEAFRHDIRYRDHFDDPSFVFALQPQAPGASDLVKGVSNWLKNFYDVLSKSGIPSVVTGYHQDISQQVILGEFDAANVDMRVCPVCDGTWMERTGTGIIGSVDHFLPRSSYPALSVHPLNLLPICVVCNEKVKMAKNPLTEGRERNLPDIFHPYIRPARGLVSLSVDTVRPWTFVSAGQATEAQLSTFPDLFTLPERWEARLDEIDRLVRRRLRDRLAALRDFRVDVRADDFRGILGSLVVDMESEWGESNHLYPATWWLRWLCEHKLDELINEFL